MPKVLPPDPQEPAVDLTREILDSPAAIEMLGILTAASLKKYGEAHFVMRPDDGVAFVEPWHVAMEPQAVREIFEKPFRFVRPILGNGQPQLTVWKGGVLWEIELVDEEDPKENSSS
jgi:hypothetical protein